MNLLQAFFLVCALSCDAFAASFAYGAERIRIPFLSSVVINSVCSCTLGASMILGDVLRDFIPQQVCRGAGFMILFIIGSMRILGFVVRDQLEKHGGALPEKELKFSNFHLFLRVICDATQADSDHSKFLSVGEAVSLAFALSLDGMAVGFGSALGGANWIEIFLLSLAVNTAAVHLGCVIGNRLAAKSHVNISWLGGAVLIILAFMRL